MGTRRPPPQRYRLLYRKIFDDALGGLSHGLAAGADFAVRLAEVRSRAASLPGPGRDHGARGPALAMPMTRAVRPARSRSRSAGMVILR
jgi:hypothetical protein